VSVAVSGTECLSIILYLMYILAPAVVNWQCDPISWHGTSGNKREDSISDPGTARMHGFESDGGIAAAEIIVPPVCKPTVAMCDISVALMQPL
jgi:hypothetical protein